MTLADIYEKFIDDDGITETPEIKAKREEVIKARIAHDQAREEYIDLLQELSFMEGYVYAKSRKCGISNQVAGGKK